MQIGAALMFNMRTPVSALQFADREATRARGAAAGLSAAFNTPLAGIVFAIEELTRSFEVRTSGVLITGIIIAGVVALGLNGNYTYFGTIQAGATFPNLLRGRGRVTGVVTGIGGGVFCWLLLNTSTGFPRRCADCTHRGRSCSPRFAAS